MSTLHRIVLTPRDGLACRDGRGWAPIGAGRAHALDWPWPSTIRGALRTAWGRAVEAKEGRTFGKDDWPKRTEDVRLHRLLVLRARRGEAGWRRVWPRPADATAYEGGEQVVRLDPRPPELPTLGRDEDPAREALWRPRLEDPRKPVRLASWWSEEAFVRWLRAETVATGDLRLAAPSRRLQTHVGIAPDTLTAEEALLFSEDVLETLDGEGEWAIGAELEVPAGGPGPLVTLGADKRLATLTPVDENLFAPPQALLEGFRQGSAGLRLIAVTPLSFARGWLPDGFEADGTEYRGRLPGVDGELVLRAAFVDRPLSVSGWDLAGGSPKPTDRMVPPGSVFFVVRADGRSFGEAEAKALWLAAMGRRSEEGFGRVVPGIWTPRE
ncbi:MAG: type III-B CRISPR module-associated Cmr3 family protein [Geminicoccaceae bacterium]|nr:type III-B CRISPR module-associated Cmr3 family protein [Geminicoccaceae bacterium]